MGFRQLRPLSVPGPSERAFWIQTRDELWAQTPGFNVLNTQASQKYGLRIRVAWRLVYKPKVLGLMRVLRGCQKNLDVFPARITDYRAAGGQFGDAFEQYAKAHEATYMALAAGVMQMATAAKDDPGAKCVVGKIALSYAGAAFCLGASGDIIKLRMKIRELAQDLVKKTKDIRKGAVAATTSVNRPKRQTR